MDAADAGTLSMDAALDTFFRRARGLTHPEVAALRAGGRRLAPTRLDLTLHPDFLSAVSRGAWTRDHERCATAARLLARDTARRLTRWGSRRAVARALEHAALAAVCRAGEDNPLSLDLVSRLDEAWRVSVPRQRLGTDAQ
jgi:hypothetical protein